MRTGRKEGFLGSFTGGGLTSSAFAWDLVFLLVMLTSIERCF